ncbi:MAG: HAMP domain-containing histidine kinase, partial [Candidatus Riflebacteria bacterium]|nr:HAMP domain-containing histidine kinase [Candidatus Riflebacteria bacterium]
AIVGYTTLAKKEKNIPPELKEYLTKIEISSRHMLAVLNDVLEMSRIESNRKELVLSENDLNLIMEEVKEMFAGQMQEKQINYSVAVENLSDPIVLCDKNCLNRILLNIISNAWKFTSEKGSVSVLLSQLSKEENVGNYEIRIKDNGVGIDEEFLPKLYNAFEREKTSTDSGLQGTGLGLAITKRIVDLMKGSISINTKKGLGTEFVINLPLTIIEQKAEEPQTKKLKTIKLISAR